MEAQAELEQEKKKKALQQQERIPIGATQHRSIDVSGSKSAVDVDIKSLEPGGIATMLQFDPYNFEEIEEEWTCNLNVNMRCWLSMELLYFVENILLLFVVYSIITYISSLVACKCWIYIVLCSSSILALGSWNCNQYGVDNCWCHTWCEISID